MFVIFLFKKKLRKFFLSITKTLSLSRCLGKHYKSKTKRELSRHRKYRDTDQDTHYYQQNKTETPKTRNISVYLHKRDTETPKHPLLPTEKYRDT